ncbi:MAG: ATP synthase subunit I [Thermosynechococcaceae cyanobacterium MS004]|nr:ATP synthase subunit I [Thermosynechococcaceae cyanobacterium MS004]
MDSQDPSIQPPSPHPESSIIDSHEPEQSSDRSMGEFYQLRQELLATTLILMAIAFGPVWWYYSLKIALNYLVGAFTGVIYLKLLARNVERLGTGKTSVGKSQLAVFVGVMIFATQWKQLEVLPVFLGFLTYKAAILVYTLKTVIAPQSVPKG